MFIPSTFYSIYPLIYHLCQKKITDNLLYIFIDKLFNNPIHKGYFIDIDYVIKLFYLIYIFIIKGI